MYPLHGKYPSQFSFTLFSFFFFSFLFCNFTTLTKKLDACASDTDEKSLTTQTSEHHRLQLHWSNKREKTEQNANKKKKQKEPI